jgi:hypothetical protein
LDKKKYSVNTAFCCSGNDNFNCIQKVYELGSSISIEMGYSLDGWGSIIITSKLALGPMQLCLQWILEAVSLRVK